MIIVVLIFSNCESTYIVIEVPASNYDIKTAARPFDTIHDNLWCLSLLQSLLEGARNQIWFSWNAGVKFIFRAFIAPLRNRPPANQEEAAAVLQAADAPVGDRILAEQIYNPPKTRTDLARTQPHRQTSQNLVPKSTGQRKKGKQSYTLGDF